MTKLKMFYKRIHGEISETYEELNKDINEYAEYKSLYIKSVNYDSIDGKIIANVLFSDVY